MAVEERVQLPNQPTSGLLENVPLGGNGLTAPHSAQVVRVNLDGDASGGGSTIYVRMDPRFVSLVSYVNLRVDGVSADQPFRMELRCTTQDAVVVGGNGDHAAIAGFGGTTVNMLWTPPPVLCGVPQGSIADGIPPYVRVDISNTNGATQVLSMRLYNFDVRAREITPVPALVSALSRSSTVTGTV